MRSTIRSTCGTMNVSCHVGGEVATIDAWQVYPERTGLLGTHAELDQITRERILGRTWQGQPGVAERFTISLDDLQWTEADTLALLRHLMSDDSHGRQVGIRCFSVSWCARCVLVEGWRAALRRVSTRVPGLASSPAEGVNTCPRAGEQPCGGCQHLFWAAEQPLGGCQHVSRGWRAALRRVSTRVPGLEKVTAEQIVLGYTN